MELTRDKLAGNSAAETAFADQGSTTAEIRSQRCLTLCPARTMAFRIIVAARKDSSALTGPCTTEYGPCREGKKKIASTLRTAITASAHTILPGLMGAFPLYFAARRFRLRHSLGAKLTNVTRGMLPGPRQPSRLAKMLVLQPPHARRQDRRPVQISHHLAFILAIHHRQPSHVVTQQFRRRL